MIGEEETRERIGEMRSLAKRARDLGSNVEHTPESFEAMLEDLTRFVDQIVRLDTRVAQLEEALVHAGHLFVVEQGRVVELEAEATAAWNHGRRAAAGLARASRLLRFMADSTNGGPVAAVSLRLAADLVARGTCDRAPQGWLCTRHPDHDGPCAAYPIPPVQP